MTHTKEEVEIILTALREFVGDRLRNPQNLSLGDRRKREFLLKVIAHGEEEIRQMDSSSEPALAPPAPTPVQAKDVVESDESYEASEALLRVEAAPIPTPIPTPIPPVAPAVPTDLSADLPSVSPIKRRGIKSPKA